MNPRQRRAVRAALIATATAAALGALALSIATGTRAGIAEAGALLVLAFAVLNIELRLHKPNPPRGPQTPNDDLYGEPEDDDGIPFAQPVDDDPGRGQWVPPKYRGWHHDDEKRN
jgi:hypothetical protein